MLQPSRNVTSREQQRRETLWKRAEPKDNLIGLSFLRLLYCLCSRNVRC